MGASIELQSSSPTPPHFTPTFSLKLFISRSFSRTSGFLTHLHILQVALWEQKSVQQQGAPIVWDYHAILVLKAKGSGTTPLLPGAANRGEVEKIRNGDSPEMGASTVGNWVYDFDTSIVPVPCRWEGMFFLVRSRVKIF